jgi:hypothetical protein
MTTPDPRDDAFLIWLALAWVAWALACFSMVRMME